MITEMFAAATIKKFVDCVAPKLSENIGIFLKDSSFNPIKTREKFYQYIDAIYESSSYLTTLVFPNNRTKLSDLYVPVTLMPEMIDGEEYYKMNSFDVDIFKKYPKIIISDLAGMGKSTLLKKITQSLIETSDSIPILIELRKINIGNSIVTEIFNQINFLNKEQDKNSIYKLLDIGGFTILFDGFDEIPFDLQEKIIGEMINFIKKASKNNFIITSRPETSLVSFVDFKLFKILPLTENESSMVLQKLDILSKNSFADNIMKEIKENNPQIEEFLTNPFLVSLLYKTYQYNKDIPSKKTTFYEEVYTCLFKYHDLSKEGFKRPKKSGIDIFDFEIILRQIAFETSIKGKTTYSRDELIKYIKQAQIKNPNIKFESQNFIEDLITTVPLFVKEGVNIKWVHKSIQDYFSAKFISNNVKKEEMIGKIYQTYKTQYLNILDLLYELENKLFRKIIIKPLLESFVRYHDTQFLKKPQDVNCELIENRISITYEVAIFYVRKNDKVKLDTKYFDFILRKVEKIIDKRCFINAAIVNGRLFLIRCVLENGFFMQELREMLFKRNNIYLKKIIPKKIDVDIPIDGLEDEVKIEKVYKVTDSLDAVCNKKDLFDNFNASITNFDKNYFFNYTKCKRILKEIEEEIANDSKEDFLNSLY